MGIGFVSMAFIMYNSNPSSFRMILYSQLPYKVRIKLGFRENYEIGPFEIVILHFSLKRPIKCHICELSL